MSCGTIEQNLEGAHAYTTKQQVEKVLIEAHLHQRYMLELPTDSVTGLLKINLDRYPPLLPLHSAHGMENLLSYDNVI